MPHHGAGHGDPSPSGSGEGPGEDVPSPAEDPPSPGGAWTMSAIVLGAVLLVLTAWLVSRPVAVEFGWFAYAPLSETTFSAPEVPAPWAHYRWAVLTGVAGALSVGLGMGFRLARPTMSAGES
ncbi:hypothetical protein [Antribacter gilvus]|uniref:hypothetical protein n=1 Tax=Antribacter gilvus TaxID=2304675 RepID=UPI000F78B897|nr:hypothetical protein [Antribacter gilvus]